MKYSQLDKALEICYLSDITPFLWGHTGVGKSSVVEQFSARRKMGFIDMRLSQCEASDIRGLPDRDLLTGRTTYRPPEELPVADLTWEQVEQEIAKAPDNKKSATRFLLQNRLEKGILFLDELPRAPEDVLQAIFQLVLNRKIGRYVLPEGWGIFCAGNFLEGYQQTGFSDPAFIARFCHLDLSTGSTTLEEWIDYMVQRHGETASPIIEFASSNVDHLDGIRPGDRGFSVLPCRRSWEMVARVMKICETHKNKNYDSEVINAVHAGLVGQAMASSLMNFKMDVKPKQIIEDGVEAHARALQGMVTKRPQLIGLMWGLLATLRPRIDEDRMANIALDFAEWMCRNVNENDLTVAFCRCMAGHGGGSDGDHIRAAAMSNARVAQLLSRVRKNSSDARKRFIERLNERPALQEILGKISWGQDVDEDVILEKQS